MSSDRKFHHAEPTSVSRPGDFWSSGYRFIFKRHRKRALKHGLSVISMDGYALISGR